MSGGDFEIRELLVLAIVQRNLIAKQIAAIYVMHGRDQALGALRGMWYVGGGRHFADITGVLKVFYGEAATISNTTLTPAL